MGLVDEAHLIGNVSNAAIGMARVGKNEQAASKAAPADISFDTATRPKLPVKLAAGYTQVAGQPGRAQVTAM